MTDEHGKNMNEEKIAKGIGELPRVGADPAYFEKLRSAFVSGELDSQSAPEEHVPERPRRAGIKWWQWATPAVAAAAIVLIVGVILNPGPPLRVLETTGDGYVRVDGSPVPLTDPGKITDRLFAGAQLTVPAGVTIDLIADDVAMYEVVTGTRMTIPATPGRWGHSLRRGAPWSCGSRCRRVWRFCSPWCNGRAGAARAPSQRLLTACPGRTAWVWRKESLVPLEETYR